MMTRKQYLLLKLAEECTEVAQRCSKQIQFGKDEIQQGQDLTNGQRLLFEVIDLATIANLLQDEEEIPQISKIAREAMREAKVTKIMKYLLYSQKLGTVTL